MAGKIFINYRRDDDPSSAARLRDALARKFGRRHLFMDVANLLPGQRFEKELDKALATCDVLIAIMGPRWMELLKAKQNAHQRDYVRDEIAAALQRDIFVIPVRVGHQGDLPDLPEPSALPNEIRGLVSYQKQDVTYGHFNRDILELANAISVLLQSKRPARSITIGRATLLVSAVAALGLTGGILASWMGVALPWIPAIRSQAMDNAKDRFHKNEEKTPTLSELQQSNPTAPVYPTPPRNSSESGGMDHKVVTGAESLVNSNFAVLSGKRVGLITNQTGMVGTRHLVDLLNSAADLKLVAMFVPEHGFLGRHRGTQTIVEAGEKVATDRDPITNVPLYSLYGDTRKPSRDMLKGLDILVFDVQDVGVRFYTYISTLGLAMQAAAAARIPFLILDRPNPLGGEYVSGFILEENQRSFVGEYSIPIVHGMTIGELGQMIVNKKLLPYLEGLDLSVERMSGWERWMRWSDIGRPWIPTSPAMNHFEAALLYPGMGLLEATSKVNDGRGTDTPFSLHSAP